MAVKTDFLAAINQVAAERGLDANDILEAIKHAIKSGVKKNYPDFEDLPLSVDIEADSGDISLYMDKKVVKNVTDEVTQLSLKKAQEIEPMLKEGDHVEVDVTDEIGDFGRVAAQTAKQVILQKLRETERDKQIAKYINRVGEIETGVVQRLDGDTVIWEIGKAIAHMPPNERIKSEFYRSGTRHKVLLKEIKETPKGKRIIVSRTDNNFLKALFELEVPELVSETIEIKSIAREPGQRSKVAVSSNIDGIDPIGACVGQKGIRIMEIMNQLKIGNSEEKVDIILWDEDEATFVSNALSPAQVVKANIEDKKNKIIKIIVPDDQLSLAIGREGQNVRLAARLTGWNIDIQGETVKVDTDIVMAKPKKDEEKATEVTDEKNESDNSSIESLELGTKVEKALDEAGIKTVEKLMEKIEAGEKITGIGPKTIEKIEKLVS